MSLLAQLDLSQIPALVTVVVGGSALLFLVNQAMTFYKEHIRERPTPADTYATKEEHARLAEKMDVELGRERGARKKIHEEIAALQGDLKVIQAETSAHTQSFTNLFSQSETLRAEVKDDVQGLHERISQVLEKVGELRGRFHS